MFLRQKSVINRKSEYRTSGGAAGRGPGERGWDCGSKTHNALPGSPLCLLSWRNKKVGPPAGVCLQLRFVHCIDSVKCRFLFDRTLPQSRLSPRQPPHRGGQERMEIAVSLRCQLESSFICYHKNSRSTRKGQWNTPLSLLLIFYQFTPIRICASSESASRMMVFSLPVRLCFSASSAKVNS